MGKLIQMGVIFRYRGIVKTERNGLCFLFKTGCNFHVYLYQYASFTRKKSITQRVIYVHYVVDFDITSIWIELRVLVETGTIFMHSYCYMYTLKDIDIQNIGSSTCNEEN